VPTPLAEALVRIRAEGSQLGPDIKAQAGAAARAAGGPAGKDFGDQFKQAATRSMADLGRSAQAALDAKKLQLDLDIAKGEAKVKELKRDAETLTESPKLDLDITKATVKLDRLKAQLEELDASPAATPWWSRPRSPRRPRISRP
jgi:hypothetical protein